MALGFFTHLAGDYAVAWKLSHEMNLPPPSDGQRNRNKARIRKHGITYRMIDINENERARDFVVALAGMRLCSRRASLLSVGVNRSKRGRSCPPPAPGHWPCRREPDEQP